MAVARQELSCREGSGRVAGPEDHHITLSVLPQGKPASQEGLHEHIAKLGVLSDNRAQVLGLQFEQRSVLRGLASIDGLPARNHEQFAGKLANPIGGDGLFLSTPHSEDLYGP